MFCHQPRMIGEHIRLVGQHNVQIFPVENTLYPGSSAVGDIRQIIDQAGHHHKKSHAEQAVFHKRRKASFPVPDPVPCPEHRKPGPGIHACPFAGAPQPEADSAEGKSLQAVRHEENSHAEIHQQNKENRIGVNGGNARLHKVHEIGGENNGAAGCGLPAPEQLFEKNIHCRQHQHAEQRARKPPPEGIHPEQGYPDPDDDLPQRRVGNLIRRHIVQMLPCRAGVIDLVKIAGVEKAVFPADSVLLIADFRHGGTESNAVAVAVKKGGFAEIGRACACNPPSGYLARVRRGKLLPPQHVACIQQKGGSGEVVLPVSCQLKGEFPIAHTGVKVNLRRCAGLGKGDDGAFIHRPHKGLRRAPAAQMRKINNAEHQRDHRHENHIQAVNALSSAHPLEGQHRGLFQIRQPDKE